MNKMLGTVLLWGAALFLASLIWFHLALIAAGS